ncbi:hypothetical protein JST97_17755 [bacterium]|nr:hypothetical protein [bacterium]
MGWKLNILARPQQPGDDLEAIARCLGFDGQPCEQILLERALHPAPGVALAFWNHHLIVLSSSLVEPLLHSPQPSASARATLQLLGPHRVLVATLHSVTNLYGFALFQGGELIRGRVGAADEGLIWQHGPAFAWEDSVEEEFDGEQAVFTFLSEVFGCSLEVAEDQLFKLEFKRYQTSFKGKIKRLFGF